MTTTPVSGADWDGAPAIAAALAHAAERPQPTALLVVGLLGLDAVRGIDGRAAAAAAVAEVRARLAGLDAEGVTVVPLDADSIALVCPGHDQHEAIRLAERVVEVVGAPIDGTRSARLSANVGVAMAIAAPVGAEALVRDADTALVAAASRGPGSVEAFGPGLRDGLAARMGTAVDLAEALAKEGELFLSYQPVFDLEHDTIVGAEALVRWRHPQRGVVSPADFIPVAEQTGLIADLGCWVLDAAVSQLSQWQRLVGTGFRLHVNLSPLEMRQPRLVAQVVDALDRHGVPAEQLLLEITETGLMTADDGSVPRLEELREIGVALGIDDFGTGYSSISYLRELPVDMVKLDRSLTSLVAASPDEYALTRAIFGLMRSSGLEIVAEGIEEHVQVAHLRAIRCRYGQGYLLARPAGPEVVAALLARRGQGSRPSGM
ncbi:putative bifunctional diguanylate cyclase/phosphodiesterase [Nocardioides gansuensis]|uniref:putative bifunctional diguanylate cyclase/phosphodiesterase n=1 Tax=Nocardioides gansuensis TaxID=2138300 RepID=UPI001057DBB9|nr:GGDEF domain-containing phosphodiesterase [Nocardioides gansuensis]